MSNIKELTSDTNQENKSVNELKESIHQSRNRCDAFEAMMKASGNWEWFKQQIGMK